MVTAPRRLYPTMRAPECTVARVEADRTYRVLLEDLRTEEAFHLACLLSGHPVFTGIAQELFAEIERSDYDADAVQLLATAGEGDQSPEVRAA